MVGAARAAVAAKGAATTVRAPNGDDGVARSGWVAPGVLRRHCNNAFMVVLDGGDAAGAVDLEASSTLVVRERIVVTWKPLDVDGLYMERGVWRFGPSRRDESRSLVASWLGLSGCWVVWRFGVR